MGVQICQASVFHSPGISAKLFSKKGRKMAAILASLLAIASLAAAKPQVGFGFPSSSSLTPLEQRVPNTCTTLSGSTCVFPFVYNGATPFQCTYSDSPTPWSGKKYFLSEKVKTFFFVCDRVVDHCEQVRHSS